MMIIAKGGHSAFALFKSASKADREAGSDIVPPHSGVCSTLSNAGRFDMVPNVDVTKGQLGPAETMNFQVNT